MMMNKSRKYVNNIKDLQILIDWNPIFCCMFFIFTNVKMNEVWPSTGTHRQMRKIEIRQKDMATRNRYIDRQIERERGKGGKGHDTRGTTPTIEICHFVRYVQILQK